MLGELKLSTDDEDYYGENPETSDEDLTEDEKT